jgi:CRISPR/Cas system Type II protein with McrA/HNH and RuvC-like nuclease domain
MKFTLSVLTIIFSISLFGFTTYENVVEKKKKIINHAELTVTVNSNDSFNFFEEAIYEPVKGDIIFKTIEKVEEISVLQEDEKLVYMLPVKTKKIIIGKSLFDRGDYKLLFKVADSEVSYITEIKVF